MAINGTAIQSAYNSTATQTLTIAGGSGWVTPTAGNLLILNIAMRVDAATTSVPTDMQGFTVIHDHHTGNGGARGILAWKIAAGTESTFTWVLHSSDIFNSAAACVAEFAITDLDVSAVAASNENSASALSAVTSVGTNAASNTVADALVIAAMMCVTDNLWNAGPPAISGYTVQTPAPSSGASPGPYIATKVVSAIASQSGTWTTTDTGGAVYAAIAIFDGSVAPPAVTFDASTKTLSSSAAISLAVTASPVFANAITALKSPGGDSISPDASASAAGAIFSIPALTQFSSAGSMNNTRLGQAGAWLVTDGSATATATLTLRPPSGYILKTLTGVTGAIPLDIGGAEDVGDDVLAWGAELIDFDTLGDPNVSAMPTTVSYRWYDVSGSAWQADGDVTISAAVVLTLSTDSATYPTDGTIAISLTPSTEEALNALTLDGVSVIADYTATGDGKAGGSLAGPSVADFMQGAGAFNGTPWFQFLDLVGGFAVAADSTAQILISGPSTINVSASAYWGGTVGENPGGILSGFTEGEPWYAEFDAGIVDSIDNGVITPLDPNGTGNLWRFTSGAWTDEGQILAQIGTIENYRVMGNHPLTIVPVFLGNDGSAVFTIQSGTLPDGLSINASTGIISGLTPDTLPYYPYVYNIVVRMTVGADYVDSNQFSITIETADQRGGRPRSREYESIYPSITEQILAEDAAVLDVIKQFVTVH